MFIISSSILRIFKWEHSFFQIVETQQNKNHQIDHITVDSMQQLIVLVHRGQEHERETSIQIYRFAMEQDDNEDTQSFHAHRTQELHMPHHFARAHLLNSSATGDLILDVCRNELSELDGVACVSYLWSEHSDGSGYFEAQMEPSIIDKWIAMTAIEKKQDLTRFKMDQDAVFLQYKVRLVFGVCMCG